MLDCLSTRILDENPSSVKLHATTVAGTGKARFDVNYALISTVWWKSRMISLELDLKVLSKVGSLHISRGNSKISRKVGVFNLPVFRTCPFAGICKEFCYGIKAENGWPFVTCARWDNFYASRRDSFVDEMVALITRMRLKVVRFHAFAG
jgi:hypothetical protein